MNPQPHFAITAPRRLRPSKRIRQYVVAFQCPTCDRYGYLEDFSGEREATCCGRTFTVECE